jgi:putative peptidoglycan lipid II flippase
VEPGASAGEPIGQPAAAASAPAPRAGAHAARVASGILLSRLSGLVREQLAAGYFALGVWADVYTVAMRLPNLLQSLLGDQALSAAFIPLYSKMLAEGRREESRRFAGAILGLLVMVAGGLALLGIVAARPLVAIAAPGFRGDAAKVAIGALPADRFALSVDQVRVLFPMAGLLVLAAWALAVLNSHRRFFLPYFAPVLWNVAIIAVLVVVGRRLGGPTMGAEARSELLYAVAWGALLGGALQLLVQLPTVVRLLGGLPLSLSTRVTGVRQALAAFGPVVAGRGAVQLSGYIDVVLASLAAAGAASALRFGLTLYLLPVSLFATSVAVTELPEMSRLDDAAARLLRLDAAWRQVWFLALPTTVGFLTFGWLVVDVVFRHGAFGVHDQLLVTVVLAAFTLGLLSATSTRLLQNVFYALHDTRYPARLAVVHVVVAAIVGATLMFWLDRYGVSQWLGPDPRGRELRLGAAGLGLGAAAGSWIELVLLARGARRKLPELRLPWRAIARMAALALAAAGLAGATWWLIAGGQRYVVAGVVLGTFAGAYLAAAALLEFPEMQAWSGRLR